MGTFATEGPVLVGGLHAGRNRVWRAEPAWMVLKVVHWGCNHCDNSSLGWCGANSLMVSGFYFSLGFFLPFFVRLRAAAPLWGGVMLCIVSGCR